MSLDPFQPLTFKPAIKGVIKQGLSKWLIGFLVLGALTSGGLIAYRHAVGAAQQEASRQLQTVPVKRVSLPIIVSANGKVEAKRSVNVSPKSAGRLQRVVVEEGDSVQAGQILAYMDASGLQGQRIEAEGQLASAQANLRKMETGNRPEEIAQTEARFKSAEASLQQAEADLRRNQQLYRQGAVSAQDYDSARATYDTSKAAVDEAREALALSRRGNRQEDIDSARASVVQAEGALTTIQTEIADTVIRAPFSGVITTLYADPGDFVAPTTSASDTSSATSASILSLASIYQVVANVAETDIARIQVGQSVTIKADAYPGETFTGQVAQVATEATVESNVTSFAVKVSLSGAAQARLRPGMNVDTEFQAGKLENVLVIPTVAIVRQEAGEGVMVMGDNGLPRFTPIETGITLGNETQVRSGLQENDRILISLPEPSSRPPGGPSILPFGGSGRGGNLPQPPI